MLFELISTYGLGWMCVLVFFCYTCHEYFWHCDCVYIDSGNWMFFASVRVRFDLRLWVVFICTYLYILCVDPEPFECGGLYLCLICDLCQVSLTRLLYTCLYLGWSERWGRHCTEESCSTGEEAKERERDADEETAAGARDGAEEGNVKVSSLYSSSSAIIVQMLEYVYIQIFIFV